MKHLTAVLVVILASTNASKYFKSEHQQQDPMTRTLYERYLPISFEDENLLPKSSSTSSFSSSSSQSSPLFLSSMSQVGDTTRWQPSPDTRTLLLTALESFDNLLRDEETDTRMKRMKASLSIDNPLDVLRQQYYRALARRMKFKSIEKNREHLIKTGKRSSKEADLSESLDKPADLTQDKSNEKETVENGYGESESWAPSLKSSDGGQLSDFIDGLGPGQLVGCQVLGSPSLGDIQLSLCYKKGYLEVEVMHSRGLQALLGSKVYQSCQSVPGEWPQDERCRPGTSNRSCFEKTYRDEYF